jgi:hypothetical protein
MTPNDVLAAGYRMSAGLFHRMVDDLTPAEFERQPVPGANCASWVVGHLTLTLRNSLRRSGVTDVPAFPEEIAGKLQTTRQAAGEQCGYGEPRALLALFDVYIERLTALIRALPADMLAGESDIKVPLATNRAEAIQFGVIHLAMHTGQLSTLRRSLGKPPVV